MSIGMSIDQSVDFVARGIQVVLEKSIRVELEKQVKPILDEAVENLAKGIMAKLEAAHFYDENDFGRARLQLKLVVDGVERKIMEGADQHSHASWKK